MGQIDVLDANGDVRAVPFNEDPPTGAKLDALLEALQAIAPISEHVAVVPNDDLDLVGVRYLVVGTGGTITVRLNGVDETYTVEDGTILPLKATRVLATGTQASHIIAWK